MAYVIVECKERETILAVSTKENRESVMAFLRGLVAENFVNLLSGYEYTLREYLISLIKGHLFVGWDSDVYSIDPIVALVRVELCVPDCPTRLLRQFAIFKPRDISTPPSPA